MSRRRAFAFPELVVSVFLLGLLGLLLAASASASWRGYRRAQGEGELQREASIAVRAICSELLLSNAASVACRPRQIVFLSPRAADDRVLCDASGAVLWQKWISFWTDADGALHRTEVMLPQQPLSTPLAAAMAPPADVFRASPSAARDRILATHLSRQADGGLTFTMPDGLQVALTVRLETTLFTDSDTVCTISDQVAPRN